VCALALTRLAGFVSRVVHLSRDLDASTFSGMKVGVTNNSHNISPSIYLPLSDVVSSRS
jgi:hypothetical protein